MLLTFNKEFQFNDVFLILMELDDLTEVILLCLRLYYITAIPYLIHRKHILLADYYCLPFLVLLVEIILSYLLLLLQLCLDEHHFIVLSNSLPLLPHQLKVLLLSSLGTLSLNH
jgi:hypothetical protein